MIIFENYSDFLNTRKIRNPLFLPNSKSAFSRVGESPKSFTSCAILISRKAKKLRARRIKRIYRPRNYDVKLIRGTSPMMGREVFLYAGPHKSVSAH